MKEEKKTKQDKIIKQQQENIAKIIQEDIAKKFTFVLDNDDVTIFTDEEGKLYHVDVFEGKFILKPLEINRELI